MKKDLELTPVNDFWYDDSEEDIPPGAWQCPYCGHMVGVYYDDGDGCDYCCPELADVDDDNAPSFVT